ncbi:MAG TPA: rRNA maturation RNase YbeY [Thermoanaerobaculia bacterium]|nr:rRNA maturation RNase YbeY [Thermoanaerobaculia bacterium]
MTNIEVTGTAVPRFTRREIAAFARSVLLALEKLDRLDRELDEVSIAFVDDDAMTSLNRKFRRKNKTTDVLTFAGEDRFLGDIVISVDQAKRQAADEKHSTATEVRYLILHGILHALGYDHETDSGEMNSLEVEVRTLVGL